MLLKEKLFGIVKKEVSSDQAKLYQQIVHEAMQRIRKDGANENDHMRLVFLKKGKSAVRLLDADVRGHIPNGVGLYVDVILYGKAVPTVILPREQALVTENTTGFGKDTKKLVRVLKIIKNGKVVESNKYYGSRKAHTAHH